MLKHVLERKQLRLAVDDRDVDNPERRLHRRQFVKLVEQDLCDRIALQLDDDTHAFAVRFIAKVRDAVKPFFLDQFGDLFNKLGLINLVGNLGDDDCVTLTVTASYPVDSSPRTHLDHTAARFVGHVYLISSVDESGCRKIWPRNDLD